jgi:hypothetical protein
MTDEDRITELFHAAASDADAPPPGFDHDDVVAVSRRITARRRSALIGGVVALLVVAGVGAVATLPRTGTSTLTTAAAPEGVPDSNTDNATGNNAATAPLPAAGGAEAAVGGADSAGGAAGTSGGAGISGTAGVGGGAGSGAAVTPGGGAASGGTGPGARPQAPGGVDTPAHPPHPLGPGTTTCADRQDSALRALVVAVLPEVARAPAAATSDICLPGTQRYLSVELGGGVLTVGYLPPGTATSLSEGARSAPTASHGTVVVSPAPGYGDRVPKLLQYLAPRL